MPEDSVFSWFMLTVIVYFGIFRLILAGIRENAQRKRWQD